MTHTEWEAFLGSIKHVQAGEKPTERLAPLQVREEGVPDFRLTPLIRS